MNQESIVTGGGISLVIHAMRTHASSSHVQQYGCQTIANIGWTNGTLQRTHLARALASLTGPTRPEPNLLGSFRTTMGKQGAVSVVLAGLERHPADEGVQVYGCWALGCLARSAGALQRSQLFVPRTRSLTNLVPQRTNVSSMPSTQSRASWRCCAPTLLTD